MAQAPSLSLPGVSEGFNAPAPPIPLPPALPSANNLPLPPGTPGIQVESAEDKAAIDKAIAELPTDGPQIINEDGTNEPFVNAVAPMEEIVTNRPPPIAEMDNLPVINNAAPPPLPPIPARRSAAIPPPPPIGGLPPIGTPLAVPSGGTGLPSLAFAAPQKSWEVPLAVTRKPKKTKFNYKRVELPESVYRFAYNRDNQHLPTRVTQYDYDQHYLHAIARNDINATRAFLNAGIPVNMRNANGDNTLIIALQFGAYDVARLLIARGANPYEPGALGLSALDYARYMHAHPVLSAIADRHGA